MRRPGSIREECTVTAGMWRLYFWGRDLWERMRAEDGQGLTEYALIIALVAVLVVGAVIVFSGKLAGLFHHATNCLGSATTATSSTSASACAK